MSPLRFYWTRPLGAEDSCRRWTVQQTASGCWATPLSTLELEATTTPSSQFITTLQVHGRIVNWHVWMTQSANTDNTDISYRAWISWLRHTCPRLERIVFLWKHDETTQATGTDETDQDELAEQLLQNLWRKSMTVPLRHVELRDDAISVAHLTRRLRTLATLATTVPIQLETVYWDAGGMELDNEKQKPDDRSDQQKNDRLLLSLLEAWIECIDSQRNYLHTLIFRGPWERYLLEQQPPDNVVNFWRALEQATQLEEIRGWSANGGAATADTDNNATHCYLKRLMHLRQVRHVYERRALIAPRQWAAVAAALPIVEIWYVDTHSPWAEENKKKKKEKEEKKTTNAAAPANTATGNHGGHYVWRNGGIHPWPGPPRRPRPRGVLLSERLQRQEHDPQERLPEPRPGFTLASFLPATLNPKPSELRQQALAQLLQQAVQDNTSPPAAATPSSCK